MKKEEIIQAFLNASSGKSYLEIGVCQGESSRSIRAREKIGVDPKFNLKRESLIKKLKNRIILKEKELLFEMTSDDFFRCEKEHYRGKIDIALIDGLHTYKQSLNDVLNALDCLAPNGAIVMHDCNPSSEAMAYPAFSYQEAAKLNLPGWQGFWCGDVWKAVVHLRCCRPDLNVFVLDCDYGVGVVTRGKPENPISFSLSDIRAFTYQDLDRKRQQLLNLKPPAWFEEFIEVQRAKRA